MQELVTSKNHDGQEGKCNHTVSVSIEQLL